MSTAADLQSALLDFPQQAAYWRQRHAAWAEPTALVRDHLCDNSGGRLSVTVELPEHLAAAAELATSGDTLQMRVLGGSVLALLAARSTDREEVTVFLPTSTAAHPNVGYAVPVTVATTDGATGQDLLSTVRTALLDAALNLDVPLHAMLDAEEIRPADLMLALDGDLTDADADARGCPLLLGLRLRPSHRPAGVDLRYDARLFSEATARRMAAWFGELLGPLLNDATQPLAALVAATAAERDMIIGKFNATAADFPSDRTLHSFLEERAAAEPDAIAVADNGMTYGQLNAAANRLARVLLAQGIGAGDVVGVCIPRSPSMLVAVYAVLKAGGAYLPIDPALPANRIAYVLENSGTPLVLVTAETAHIVAEQRVIDLAADEIANADSTDPATQSSPDDLAYIIYTSGSTGRPKGVMVEHRAIVNRLWWMQRAHPLGSHDVILHKTPFTFDVSVWEIFWWSLAGASVVTLANGEERDPQRIARRIAEARVTTIHFVPSMLHAFLHYTSTTREPLNLTSLRRVFASGEALAVSQTAAFSRHLGAFAQLVNLYGPTEAAVDVTCQPCDDVDTTRSVPIGRPIDNIRIYIRTRSGDLAPVGTPGELCIAGVGLARGYRNAPDLTDQQFIQNPFEDDGRLYRTGDLARWLADGTIEYLGRIDKQVKIRGYRIEPGEIEYVTATCPGVVDCAVTTVQNRTGNLVLVAYVVTEPGQTPAGLREALSAELPSYMVPPHIVEVAAIPTNHNGKRNLAPLPNPTGAPRAAVRQRP